MDDVGGADGKRLRLLQPGGLVGDEDDLGVLRPGLELVPELENVLGIVEIDVEDVERPQLGIQAAFNRLELDLAQAGELLAETVAIDAHIPKKRYLMHGWGLKNSSSYQRRAGTRAGARM